MTNRETTALAKAPENDWLTGDWQTELQHNVTSVAELAEHLPLSAAERADLERVTASHPLNIPRYYLELIDPDDPQDPIRRLAVPSSDELIVAGAMGATTGDPYGDDKHDKGNGILHKYPYSAPSAPGARGRRSPSPRRSARWPSSRSSGR